MDIQVATIRWQLGQLEAGEVASTKLMEEARNSWRKNKTIITYYYIFPHIFRRPQHIMPVLQQLTTSHPPIRHDYNNTSRLGHKHFQAYLQIGPHRIIRHHS